MANRSPAPPDTILAWGCGGTSSSPPMAFSEAALPAKADAPGARLPWGIWGYCGDLGALSWGCSFPAGSCCLGSRGAGCAGACGDAGDARGWRGDGWRICSCGCCGRLAGDRGEPLPKMGTWLMEGTRLAADWVRGPQLLKGCSRWWRGLLPSACRSASRVSRRCAGEAGAAAPHLTWPMHLPCMQELAHQALHWAAEGPCMLWGSFRRTPKQSPPYSLPFACAEPGAAATEGCCTVD